MVWISFGVLPCRGKKLDDSSRLDVVEIARVPDMLPSFSLPGRAKDLSDYTLWERKMSVWTVDSTSEVRRVKET